MYTDRQRYSGVRRDQDRGRSLATALHVARNVTGKEQPTLYVTYCFIIELRINSYGEQLKFMIVIEMFLFCQMKDSLRF